MKLEQQVVSLDLAKRLKELGAKQESYAFWNARPNDPPVVLAGYELGAFNSLNTPKRSRIASAFTVAELGELLGKEANQIMYAVIDGQGEYASIGGRSLYELTNSDNEADARGKMLVYLLEQKLITL